MGCTSSAPNTATPRTNSEADFKRGNIPTKAEDTSTDIEMDAKMDYETNGANMLPKTCDNLIVLTEFDRSNKKIFDILKPEQKNGNPNDKNIQSNEQEIINNKITVDDKEDIINNSTQDKLSTLEEVVEKVVEFYVVADRGIEITKTVSDVIDNTYLNEDECSANNINNAEQPTDEVEPIETKSVTCEREDPACFVSPSQSQGSRATRWEALADVAAELPPSLAVDPLTGQIYALSK